MLGVVVGLAAEARIASRLGCPIRTSGGTPAGAEAAAMQLVAEGATALVSFGVAGGLDPSLRPGALIVPSVVLWNRKRLPADPVLARPFGGFTDHIVIGSDDIAADPAAKRRLRITTGAHAIDLESGAIASLAEARGLPFLAVRAICDPAERTLPPAALVGLRADGGIDFGGVLRTILSQPGQIAALLVLTRDAALARRALVGVTKRVQLEAQRPESAAPSSDRSRISSL